MGWDPADERWMALALALGRRNRGRVWPNPAVGCVIVSEGLLVGRGATAPGGRPHAETIALKQAGARAEGATAYVTLEPCAHHGQTPPCANALVKAGISRVVSATGDPDPRVAGKGHAILTRAGVALSENCRAQEAVQDHAGFLSRVLKGRPFVSLKLASSLDGRIATSGGESQWITGPSSRRFVHGLRAVHDAVMVGSGTALSDDPTLTVRDLGCDFQPVRVICDTQLRTPAESRLGTSIGHAPLWICHGPGARGDAKSRWRDLGATLLECDVAKGSGLDLGNVLTQLADHGLTRVLCEGGGILAASLLESDLVDQLYMMNAGLALGAKGKPSVAPLRQRALRDYPRFELAGHRAMGADILSIWTATRV